MGKIRLMMLTSMAPQAQGTPTCLKVQKLNAISLWIVPFVSSIIRGLHLHIIRQIQNCRVGDKNKKG